NNPLLRPLDRQRHAAAPVAFPAPVAVAPATGPLIRDQRRNRLCRSRTRVYGGSRQPITRPMRGIISLWPHAHSTRRKSPSYKGRIGADELLFCSQIALAEDGCQADIRQSESPQVY